MPLDTQVVPWSLCSYWSLGIFAQGGAWYMVGTQNLLLQFSMHFQILVLFKELNQPGDRWWVHLMQFTPGFYFLFNMGAYQDYLTDYVLKWKFRIVVPLCTCTRYLCWKYIDTVFFLLLLFKLRTCSSHIFTFYY